MLPLGESFDEARKTAKGVVQAVLENKDARKAAVAQVIAARKRCARAPRGETPAPRRTRGRDSQAHPRHGRVQGAARPSSAADFAVRHVRWPKDLWLPVQLKSDGGFDTHGAPKPDDSKSRSGGSNFRDCKGYDGMPVLFVKRRHGADTFWATDGSTIKSDTLVEHTDGALGPDCLPTIRSTRFLRPTRRSTSRTRRFAHSTRSSGTFRTKNS